MQVARSSKAKLQHLKQAARHLLLTWCHQRALAPDAAAKPAIAAQRQPQRPAAAAAARTTAHIAGLRLRDQQAVAAGHHEQHAAEQRLEGACDRTPCERWRSQWVWEGGKEPPGGSLQDRRQSCTGSGDLQAAVGPHAACASLAPGGQLRRCSSSWLTTRATLRWNSPASAPRHELTTVMSLVVAQARGGARGQVGLRASPSQLGGRTTTCFRMHRCRCPTCCGPHGGRRQDGVRAAHMAAQSASLATDAGVSGAALPDWPLLMVQLPSGAGCGAEAASPRPPPPKWSRRDLMRCTSACTSSANGARSRSSCAVRRGGMVDTETAKHLRPGRAAANASAGGPNLQAHGECRRGMGLARAPPARTPLARAPGLRAHALAPAPWPRKRLGPSRGRARPLRPPAPP